MARIAVVLWSLWVVGCTTPPVKEFNIHSPSNLPQDTLNVAFLVVDGVYNTEFTAAYDIFHHTKFRTGIAPMRVFSISLNGSLVKTFEGMRIVPDYSIFSTHPSIDVLAIPSAEHHLDTDLENDTLIEWIRTIGSKAEYVISFCDGAFPVAKAGLLRGLRCTTFPGDVGAFKKMFPDHDVYADVLWVHDGKVITSAGGAKSFEPALYLCELLYGPQVAQEIGKGMVIDWKVSDYSFLSPFGDNLSKK